MKKLPTEPTFEDPSLAAAWEQDPFLQEAHGQLAATPLRKFWDAQPGVERPDPDSDEACVVDLAPDEDHDRTSAVAIFTQWENGWRPAIAYNARLLQSGLEVPTRFLVFPSGKGDVNLTDAELSDVRGGNFAPPADRAFRTAARMGIERLQIVGGSQGATVGAAGLRSQAASGKLITDRAVLTEAVNIIDRPKKEIEKGFRAVGLGRLNNAKNASAIPGLSESEQSRGGLETPKQLIGFTGMLRPSEYGKAAKDGFTFPRFQVDLAAAADGNPDLRVLAIRGAESTLAITGAMQVVRSFLEGRDGVNFDEVAGYGHELIDNIAAMALKNKQGLLANA